MSNQKVYSKNKSINFTGNYMCQQCITNVNRALKMLHVGQSWTTPDSIRARPFTITAVNQNSIFISPQNIRITFQAFHNAVLFLCLNSHQGQPNSLPIGSSNSPSLAGPLCRSTRNVNSGTRCINYITSILGHFNVLNYNGTVRPNTIWL